MQQSLFAGMKLRAIVGLHLTARAFVVFLLKNCVKKWRDGSRHLSTLCLLIELKRADFLLDIASHTFDIERRESLCQKALKSYNSVVLAAALPPTNSSADTGRKNRIDLLSIPSIKCRD